MLFRFVKIVSTEWVSEVIEADSYKEAWARRDEIDYSEGDTFSEISEIQIANDEDDLCDNVIYCKHGLPLGKEVTELINELNNN